MISWSYTIKDEEGLHAKPAVQIASAMLPYPCQICLDSRKGKADAKNILAMLALGIGTGEEVLFSLDGEKEEDALKKLQELTKKIGF